MELRRGFDRTIQWNHPIFRLSSCLFCSSLCLYYKTFQGDFQGGAVYTYRDTLRRYQVVTTAP